MPVLAAWWLFVAPALGALERVSGVRPHAALLALFLFVLLLGMINAFSVLLPRHNRSLSPPFRVVQSLHRLTAADDVVVVNRLETLGLQILYFSNRQVVGISLSPGTYDLLSQRLAQ